MTFQSLTVAGVVGAAVLATGCSDLTEAIGLSRRTPPDEFQVVTNAPLSVPPDFALRPPTPGDPGPVALTAQSQARAAVVGSTGTPSSGATAGEQAILANADAIGIDPGIRQTVDNESRILADEGVGTALADILLFWRDTPQAGQIVDAAAEAERIRANQASGRPITEGETPVIERTNGPIRLF